MLRLAILLVLVNCLPCRVDAQALLRVADSLVNQKQYNSAFKLLHDYPGSDTGCDIVLKKTDIALNWFVQSIMHRLFSFKDLSKDETIDDYRGQEGQYAMYEFAIDSTLSRLIETYPKDGRLYRSLADFYYDVFWKYGDSWLVSRDSIALLTQQNYTQAISNGISDYDLFHNLGVAYLHQHKFINAINSFKESLKLNPQYASSNYNLSYSYMKIDSLADAAQFAENAFNLYDNPYLKADAAHLAGICYREMKSNARAILFLSAADSINPGDYAFTRHLLQAYLDDGRSESADKTATRLFELGPEKPKICSDILDMYYDSPLKNSLPGLFRMLLETHKMDSEIVGNLSFHLSSYFEYEKDNRQALDYLVKARNSFHKCLPDTHYVFSVINERQLRLQSKQ